MDDARENFRPLYRTMVGLGMAAVVILGIGFATLLRYAPPGERTGARANVVGVFAYDPSTEQTQGPVSTHFPRDEPFAAEVDWHSLPPAMVVAAFWYDSLSSLVGQVGPAPASDLAGQQALVPVRTPFEFHTNLPGTYTLIIVRYSHGQPVEVLATESVVVLRD